MEHFQISKSETEYQMKIKIFICLKRDFTFSLYIFFHNSNVFTHPGQWGGAVHRCNSSLYHYYPKQL